MGTIIKQVGATEAKYSVGDVLEKSGMIAVVFDISRTEYRLMYIGDTTKRGDTFKIAKGILDSEWELYSWKNAPKKEKAKVEVSEKSGEGVGDEESN